MPIKTLKNSECQICYQTEAISVTCNNEKCEFHCCGECAVKLENTLCALCRTPSWEIFKICIVCEQPKSDDSNIVCNTCNDLHPIFKTQKFHFLFSSKSHAGSYFHDIRFPVRATVCTEYPLTDERTKVKTMYQIDKETYELLSAILKYFKSVYSKTNNTKHKVVQKLNEKFFLNINDWSDEICEFRRGEQLNLNLSFVNFKKDGKYIGMSFYLV